MSRSSTSDSYICPVFATNGKCGEQDALRVMEEFKDFYEGKLNEVDVQGGGDCMEMKLKIQRRWIEDLTEQTQMMARIVKELEDEATTRVRMLEDKLRQTSKSAYEVMKRYQTYNISHNLDEPFQKVFYLENDLKNLIEFIRRIRDDKQWSIDGLRFFEVTSKDLFGKDNMCDFDDKGKEALLSSNKLVSDKKKEKRPDEVSEKSFENNQTYDELFEQLEKKTVEYELLRQSMLDMRMALTEEVACKHDIITALKKDVQQLEERCLQADKQTAFKDDIIKELRKEIKQIKQQNKGKEEDLEKQLLEARAEMKRMKPCVDMISACTAMDDNLVIKKSKLIQNKDDIIQIQNNTLNVIDIELQAARKREKDLEEEVDRKRYEIEELKSKCVELEQTLASSQGRAENLQNAIDLYINSINVLEATEEKARIEIEQQKMTIANLQEALVNVKQELDELRQQSQQEIGNHQYLCDIFYINLLDVEKRNTTLDEDISQKTESYKKLQDCCFELEIEHFNVLQDLMILETRLHKYQSESKIYEESKFAAKTELKKLRQQNRCYERVVDCFKHEMAVMSEQLVHLQEILNLSNQSCREENGQLYGAVVELQKLSEKLQAELINTEKKVLIENQKSQLKDAKIGELQMIIGQKNVDLNVHDEAINDMKMRLDNALMENQELQNTIVGLNTTIMQLQVCLQTIEMDKMKKTSRSMGVGCKRSFSDCTDSYDRRSRKDRCQVEFVDRSETIKTIQKEFEKSKEKNKEKVKNLKRQNEELKDKLATSELSTQRLLEQSTHLKEQLKQSTQKACCQEHELTQCKQIIIELRQTLIELNESLADSELHQTVLTDELHKSKSRESEQDDLYLSCRCEIALYKKLAESFKETLVDMRKKLKEVEARNKMLNEELKMEEAKINEIQKKAIKKDKESCQYIDELREKLRESQEEEKRLSNFIENLKQEVQKRIDEKKEKTVINYCECSSMNATQQEINSLKIEIKNMIQNQLALNSENDKLLRQVTSLQTNVATLDEKNRQLKQKLEKLQSTNQNLKDKNNALSRERENLAQTVKNLEAELTDMRNTRDDLCVESRHVVNNVKAWLEEQKKINEKVKKKTQCYCDTIAKLQQENEALSKKPPVSGRSKYERTAKPCTQINCSDFWLGSEGTGSVIDSPRDSPVSCICSMEEWYSPNYRDDDETENDDEHFINTLESITREIKSSNKKWKVKCQECQVSKDEKL